MSEKSSFFEHKKSSPPLFKNLEFSKIWKIRTLLEDVEDSEKKIVFILQLLNILILSVSNCVFLLMKKLNLRKFVQNHSTNSKFLVQKLFC